MVFERQLVGIGDQKFKVWVLGFGEVYRLPVAVDACDFAVF